MSPGFSDAQPAATPVALTLEAALAQTFEKHPELKRARARILLKRALVVGAGVFPFNPELGVEGAARIGPVETSADFEISLQQWFEIAGQRGHRKNAARLELDAASHAVQRSLRLIGAEVRIAFADAVTQRELLEIAEAEAEISAQLVDLAQRRVAAGAGTRLEVAVAGAELGKSAQQVNTAAGEYAIARSELAYVIGLAPGSLPVPTGDLSEQPELTISMADLMGQAVKNRRDLVALRTRQDAARARLELARAEAWPDVALSAFAGREGDVETLVGGGLTIELPVLRRNQGGIAVAQAEAVETEAEAALADQRVLREVATAFQQYSASRKALRSLRRSVVGTTEALHLLRRAFETGKSGWIEILVMRRTLFDAQRALVEIAASAHRARLMLDLATGATPIAATRPVKDAL